MENLFILIVILMFLLAIADLIVGVSNDAVNFLNSAIGSHAGRRRTIMIVASLGILVGAAFSSGMMEVARKGIFNPQYFAISEIMILFCAVMLTDILLLDFFNTLSLPTSTTVSIVFELFGAAVILAVLKTSETGGNLSDVMTYINNSRALLIIGGIFLSIIFAFFFGWLIQYLTRLAVSFDYQRRMRIWGGIIGGISMGIISLFILFKGVKGASFLSTETIDWIHSHALLLSLYVILAAGIITQILILTTNFDVFRFITMLGTFALAMAFASNDLVNFIGVPVASFQSFRIWSSSGLPADGFMMEELAEPVQTNPLFLIVAGIVMIGALWFSRKARSVTATTINLARQAEGYERFKANDLSRAIVGVSLAFGDFVSRFTPSNVRVKVAEQFKNSIRSGKVKKEQEVPAFDLVRAAISLVIASLLISIGTNYKLPLSTTYVSFMVAMGTSLADKAWGRESAVYRVSGVFTVIGGWFSTAIIAFLISGFFALMMWYFGGWALGVIVILAVFSIIKTTQYHRNQERLKETEFEEEEWLMEQVDEISVQIRRRVNKRFGFFIDIYDNAINYLIAEKRNKLAKIRDKLNKQIQKHHINQARYSYELQQLPEEHHNTGRILLVAENLETRLFSAISNIVNACEIHVNNLHAPLKKRQQTVVQENKEVLEQYFRRINKLLEKDIVTDLEYDELIAEKDKLISKIEGYIQDHIQHVGEEQLSTKNSQLYITLLMETKDIISVSTKYIKLYRKAQQPISTSYMVEIAEK